MIEYFMILFFMTHYFMTLHFTILYSISLPLYRAPSLNVSTVRGYYGEEMLDAIEEENVFFWITKNIIWHIQYQHFSRAYWGKIIFSPGPALRPVTFRKRK